MSNFKLYVLCECVKCNGGVWDYVEFLNVQ